MMGRFGRIAAAAAALFALSVGSAFAEARLREAIVAQGPAVTLGDFFENAGDAAGRAVAPAPPPGQSTTFPARFVTAAAAAAGLDWSAPAGMEEIRVTRAGGSQAAPARRAAGGDLAIRRGEAVMLVYVAPGLQLTARGRALSDAAVGDPIRVINLQSNVAVDAVATGPGAASASALR